MPSHFFLLFALIHNLGHKGIAISRRNRKGNAAHAALDHLAFFQIRIRRQIHRILALWTNKFHSLKVKIKPYRTDIHSIKSMQTPQIPAPTLAAALCIPEIVLKREDLHPYGSHKGRSIPMMIEHYRDLGHRDFVLSSSGNAGIAAAHAVHKYNQSSAHQPMTLTIFVGHHIEKEKLNTLLSLASNAIRIEQVDKPKHAAIQVSQKTGAILLRQSTDDTALLGYDTLAEELSLIPNLAAIFIPTSSGTTALALANIFEKKKHPPQIHVVQTTAVHPIADIFDTNFQETKNSLASAIVDRVGHRKHALAAAIRASGGSGWVVSDQEITAAIELVKKTTDINISATSALAIAGLKKALDAGTHWTGPVVCLITGK